VGTSLIQEIFNEKRIYNDINAQWKDYRLNDGKINEDKITFIDSGRFAEFTKDVKKMLKKYQDKINLFKTKIKENDEWIIQAHSETDYFELENKQFVKNIKKQILFNIKK